MPRDAEENVRSKPGVDSASSSSDGSRWSQISEIVADAWEMEATQRETYLAEVFRLQPSLRAEVERLLGERDGISGFLERGAMWSAPPDLTGATLGSYVLESKIGEGGMGVVYRAHDNRLQRDVAVKIVRMRAASPVNQRQQFLREARTTAALNHPNIITIYDVGSSGETDFIAMEFVQGVMLDRLIPAGGLPLQTVLRYGKQIVSALATAHAARIIHRDLKPGNIIVDRTGTVKVLDFGLARYLGETDDAGKTGMQGNLHVAAENHPFTGAIAGTICYLSPEQAEGARLDARSDLFSFGAVLFEMLTGRKAFSGGTTVETLGLVRRAEHPQLSDLTPGLPRKLDWLVSACLEREPANRTGSAQEALDILEELEIAATRPATQRTRLFVTLGLLAVVGGVWWFTTGSDARRGLNEPALMAVPLTGNATSEFSPVISPGGDRVAFAGEDSPVSTTHIYVKPAAGGKSVAITSGPTADLNPEWSPDGSKIAFSRYAATGSHEVWIVGSGGGEPRKLTDFETQPIAVSGRLTWPDARYMIVSREQSPGEAAALFRLTVATGETQQISRPPEGISGDFSPHVSPDHRSLVFIRAQTWNVSSLYLLQLSPEVLGFGDVQRVRTGELQPSGVSWAGRNDGLIFTAGFAQHSLWRLDLRRNAAPYRLNVLGGDDGVSADASAGGTLVFARQHEESQVWRMNLDPVRKKGAAFGPLITSLGLDLRPQYSPDGKQISSISLRSGFAEIWIHDAHGSHGAPITSRSDPTTGNPSWSPDGKFLAFDAAPEGKYDIFKMPSSGGAAVRLTEHRGMNTIPTWSRDGKWIYFASSRSGSDHIYKIALDGSGEGTRVTEHGGLAGMESPDARFLYFAETRADSSRMWRKSLDSGAEERGPIVYRRSFVPVEDGVYYVTAASARGPSSVRFWSSRTGNTQFVRALEANVASGFLGITPDRSFLLLTRYKLESHAMIVHGFR